MGTRRDARALAATLHDPDERFSPAILAATPSLAGYGTVVVAATAATAAATRALLEARGVTIIAGDARVGTARRAAVAKAHALGAESILACDFDRWLHWAGRFPAELAAVPDRLARRRPRPWYACLGRTARALATHPPVQRVTEGATNRALSLAVGRRLDATAGACWLARPGAELILRESVETTNATDLEWPTLIHRTDPRRLTSLRVEGLEFETATFFPAEVAAAGGEAAWIRAHYDRPEVWRDRLRLSLDSVSAACRVLGQGEQHVSPDLPGEHGR